MGDFCIYPINLTHDGSIGLLDCPHKRGLRVKEMQQHKVLRARAYKDAGGWIFGEFSSGTGFALRCLFNEEAALRRC